MATPTFIERLIDPIGRALTPEAAREILALRADEETQRHIDELADKCNEGALSPAESRDYQEFIALFNILTVLQARARSVLAGRNASEHE